MRKTQQTLWLAGFTGVSTACIISLLTTDIASVDRRSTSQPHALLAANIDHDQLVTLREVRQMLEGHFGRLDTNNDGMINPDEYAEQHIKLSDVVTILFNLSNIPDSVASKINFLEPKYGALILAHMNDYKLEFEKKYKVAWEYSNQNLFDCYD